SRIRTERWVRRHQDVGTDGRGSVPPGARKNAGRKRVPQPLRHTIDVSVPSRSSVCVFRWRPGIQSEIYSGGIGGGYLRRKFELARTDLDARQLAHSPVAAVLVSILR